MRAILAIFFVAVLGGVARGEPAQDAAVQATAQAIVDAIARQDAAAFARIAPDRIAVASIWFASPACAKQFSGQFVLREASYPAFLQCLGAMGVRSSPTDAGAPGLVYEPGVHLELTVRDGELLAIDGSWLAEPAAAPISQQALAEHELAPPKELEAAADVREAVARSPDAPAFVELSTCVDQAGKLERSRLRRRSPGYDSYVRAIETRAESRRFRPFTVHGKAVRVCARELFTYPADRRAHIPTRSHVRIIERSDQAAQDDTARAVADAIARRDLAAFARLVPPDAVLSAIWFDDAACARQFSGSFAPTERIRAALVTCLAGLGLQAGPSRRILPWVDPRPTLVYGPGVVLWLTVRDGAVIDIDTEWEDTADPSAAPVSPDALEAHLVAPVVVEPDAAVREALNSPASGVAFAHMRACVDRTGKLETLGMVSRSKDHDSYVHAVEAAAARWRFTPFQMRNQPVRVCGRMLFAYPPDRRDEVFPMPPPPPLPDVIPQNLAPTQVDAGRVAGEQNIVPDDATKNEIARSGKHRVIGSYKLCISTEGNVFSVKQLRSTTFPAYDVKIMKTIREGWRYRPFTVKGKAVPVCTAVTFVYSQKDWQPPLPAPAPAPRP